MYQNENLSVRASDEFMKRGDRGQGFLDQDRPRRQTVREEAREELLRGISEGPGSAAIPACSSTTPPWLHTARGPTGSTRPIPAPSTSSSTTRRAISPRSPDEVQKADGSFTSRAFRAAVRVYITAQEILVDNASIRRRHRGKIRISSATLGSATPTSARSS